MYRIPVKRVPRNILKTAVKKFLADEENDLHKYVINGGDLFIPEGEYIAFIREGYIKLIDADELTEIAKLRLEDVLARLA